MLQVSSLQSNIKDNQEYTSANQKEWICKQTFTPSLFMLSTPYPLHTLHWPPMHKLHNAPTNT